MIRAPGFWWDRPGAAAAVLSPAAAIYGAVAAWRLSRPGARADVPVICVGNPTVGGAGKTPTAIAIGQMLTAAGEHPVFLTRGYGGRLAGPAMVEVGHTAMQVGDEPLLLARSAPTVVAQNRVAGAKLARQLGASVIVMDDGFQNPSLHKDVSILVGDGRRGVGNARVLPAGPLRAPLEAQLDRASAVLIVGDATAAEPVVLGAHARSLPLFRARLDPDRSAVAALAERQVLAFAGIGDPEKFFATLAAAGIDAPLRRSYPDHHHYTPREAVALLRNAERNNLLLLTTEKDLVRIQSDAFLHALAERTYALPVTLAVTEADALQNFVIGAARGR